MSEARTEGALTVENLTVGYGGRPVIHGLSLAVEPEECVAILGSNGSGKSSTIAAIAGLLRPVISGTVTLGDLDLTRASAAEVVRSGIRLVPEGRRLFTSMSVSDNVELGGFTISGRRLRRERLDEVLHLFPRLVERRKQTVGTLSGGERQMVSLARAVMTRPKFLLLDEPSLGLAPAVVRDLADVVEVLSRSGTGVVLIEQNLGLARRLADRYYLLDRGRVVRSGGVERLLSDTEIAGAYLGQGSIVSE